MNRFWRRMFRRVAEFEEQLAAETRAPTVKRDKRPQCGARTRAGGACLAPAVWDFDSNAPRNGRCRMHGGLSTGPKTEEGRTRIRESNRRRVSRSRPS